MKAKVFRECCFSDLFLNSHLLFSSQLTEKHAGRRARLNGLRDHNAAAYNTGIMEVAGDKPCKHSVSSGMTMVLAGKNVTSFLTNRGKHSSDLRHSLPAMSVRKDTKRTAAEALLGHNFPQHADSVSCLGDQLFSSELEHRLAHSMRI